MGYMDIDISREQNRIDDKLWKYTEISEYVSKLEGTYSKIQKYISKVQKNILVNYRNGEKYIVKYRKME